MTVFKAFLHVLNKNKSIVLLYTIILVFFGAFNMKTADNNTGFTMSKPDVLIVNQDEDVGLTKNLISYLEKNSNQVKVKLNEDSINDALFYRDVNYIIYIPKNFRKDFLAGKNPVIQVKSTKDYQASLAEMLLKRYLAVANTYKDVFTEEEELIKNINNTLTKTVSAKVTSKLDSDGLQKASYYFNFFSYSMMAGTIYVICLILSSFYEENVKKRTAISSMNYKKQNRILLLSNSLFAFSLWLLYILLGFILCGKTIVSVQGIIYILNSFVFTICCVTLAFLISNLVKNKEAINGIVNVVALGSSFLCGAFVPTEYLPTSVLKLAHILPTYWFINSNDCLKTVEIINSSSLKPIIINMLVILGFSLLFIIITNIVSKKKQKIA